MFHSENNARPQTILNICVLLMILRNAIEMVLKGKNLYKSTAFYAPPPPQLKKGQMSYK